MTQLMALLEAQVTGATNLTPPLAQTQESASSPIAKPVPVQAPPPIQNLPNQTPPISQMANPTPTPISKGVSPTPLTINVLSSEKTAGMPTKNGGGEDESHPGSRPVWEQWIFKFVPLSQYVHSKKFKMLELDKYDGTDFSGELKRGGLDVVH